MRPWESVAHLAERAGHGLGAAGCSDGVRFGFLRRELGGRVAIRRAAGLGFVRRGVGGRAVMAACCQVSGSFGGIKYFRLRIRIRRRARLTLGRLGPARLRAVLPTGFSSSITDGDGRARRLSGRVGRRRTGWGMGAPTPFRPATPNPTPTGQSCTGHGGIPYWLVGAGGWRRPGAMGREAAV
jgi:hypothetical protein